MFTVTEKLKPVTETDVEKFLTQIHDTISNSIDSRPFCTASASEILGKKATPRDSRRFAEILADSTRNKWLRCVAANALRYSSNKNIARFLSESFNIETDIDVKIQLLFSICDNNNIKDPYPYQSFVEQQRENYIAHNVIYAGGNQEKWKEHSLSRLQSPQYANRRWLYLYNLECLGFTGTMIRAQNIRKLFSTSTGAVRGIDRIDLDVKKGEFITVFGPNGCGKSTLINIIAGLSQTDEGTLTSDYGLLSEIKKCYVWQNYRDALLPWRNVVENISFPLKLKGVKKAKRHEQALEIMERFGVKIDPHAKVYSLSGGEQQIISILRGLIIEPEIMLLDEPFSALDYQMNLVMAKKIMDIWSQTKLTVIYVSHDLDQAILLADRLVLVSPGPGHVRKIFENTLPRPRTVDMLGHPQHVALKKEVLELYQMDLYEIRSN